MRRLLVISALCTATAASAAADAGAQDPTDPDANSPAGTIYEIPIDTARRDGAPRRGGRDGSGRADGRSGGRGGGSQDGRGSADGDGSPEGSSIRSENNFGSSSHVPGLSGSDDSSARREANGERGEGSDATDSGGPGSGGGSAGSGRAGGTGGPEAAGRDVAPASALTPGDVSPSAGIALLALVALLGGYVGVLAARANRRGTDA